MILIRTGLEGLQVGETYSPTVTVSRTCRMSKPHTSTSRSRWIKTCIASLEGRTPGGVVHHAIRSEREKKSSVFILTTLGWRCNAFAVYTAQFRENCGEVGRKIANLGKVSPILSVFQRAKLRSQTEASRKAPIHRHLAIRARITH